MNSIRLGKGIGGAILTLTLLLGIGIVGGATASAQHRHDQGGYYGNDVYQVARDQGYRDGVDHGAEHARNRDRYNPQGTSHYKDATSGYRSGYGSKDGYKQAYREGFLRGYEAGYQQYGGYGQARGNDPYYGNNDPYYGRGSGGYGNSGGYGGYGRNDIYRVAEDQGYRDGIDHGAEHAREGKRYDPQSARHYKDGDNGYRSGYGNKDQYRQVYRESFLRGYDEGYRRSGGNGSYGRRNSRRRVADILGGILGRP